MKINGNNEFKLVIFEEIGNNTEVYNFHRVLLTQSKQISSIEEPQKTEKRKSKTSPKPLSDSELDQLDDTSLKKKFLNLNFKYFNVSFNFLDSTKHSNDYFRINNVNRTLSMRNQLDRDSLCENKIIKTCNCHSQCILKLDIIANGYKIDKNTLKNQYMYNSGDLNEGSSEEEGNYEEDDDDESSDTELINEIIASHKNSYFDYIFTLNVHILDINDNIPYFSRSEYTIEVPENVPIGHRIPLQLIANDKDYGKNSIVSYALVNNSSKPEMNDSQTVLAQLSSAKNTHNSVFEIDYSNLKNLYLKVNSELDRENRSNYSFYIVAIDGGRPPYLGSVEFFIKIVDHNDNSPYFKNTSHLVNISESTAIGTKLLSVIAYDMDEGQNGQIEYFIVLNKNFQQHKLMNYQNTANHAISMQNENKQQLSMQQVSDDDNDYFKIDKDTGDLFLKNSLDYEKQNYFKLIVSAIDKGIPSLYSFNQCIVEVFIYDENDNAPEIRVITSEQIQQQDKQLGKTNFKIGSAIQQQNHQQTLYIHESAPVGTFICLITINDVDTGMNGKFELNSKITPNDGKIKLSDSYTKIDEILVVNSKNNFSPTMKTYALLVAKSLDRETQANYKIHVIARDFGAKKRLESELSINLAIIDVNDNKPEFKLLAYSSKNEKSSAMKLNTGELRVQYDYYINENNMLNAKIGCYECFDRDENENSQIDYFLSTNDTFIATNDPNSNAKIYNLIRVDPDTKCLHALISFDREIRDFYEFYLIAVDQSKAYQKLNSSALIQIHVNDVNDHVPYFTQSKYEFNLAEHSRTNTIIGQLRAYDLDINENSKLEYKFTPSSISNNNNMIKLNQTNGVISYIGTELQLDADKELYEFTFEVSVNDKGVPSFGTTCQVKIKIVDVNDNCPRIEAITDKKKLIERTIKRKDFDDTPTVDIESALFYVDRDILIKEYNDDINENAITLGKLILVDRDRDSNNNRPNISNQAYTKLMMKKTVNRLGDEIIIDKSYFNLTHDGYLRINLVKKSFDEELVKNKNDDLLSISHGYNIETSYYIPTTGLYKISFTLSDSDDKVAACTIKTKFILILIGDEQFDKPVMIKASYDYMKESLQRTMNINRSSFHYYNENVIGGNSSIKNNFIDILKSLFQLNTSNQVILFIFFLILFLIAILLSILCVYCICKYNRKCFRANRKQQANKYKEIASLINNSETNNNSSREVETLVNRNGHVELHNKAVSNYYTSKPTETAVAAETASHSYKLLVEKPQVGYDPNNNRYGTLVTKSNGSVESAYSASSSNSSPITTSTITSTNVNNKNRSVLV